MEFWVRPKQLERVLKCSERHIRRYRSELEASGRLKYQRAVKNKQVGFYTLMPFADAGRRAERRGRTETRPLLPEDEAIADQSHTPEERLIGRASDRSAQLTAMIDALPPERAEALRLYYYSGKSLKAIADIQGVAPATAKSRLHRGLKALWKQREKLE